MGKRRNYSADFKSKLALAAILGGGTIAELASRYGVHANVITKRKREALEGMKETFDKGNGKQSRLNTRFGYN